MTKVSPSILSCDFSKLKDEQRKWVSDKEDKVKAAGKEFEGGSMAPCDHNLRMTFFIQTRIKELKNKWKI